MKNWIARSALVGLLVATALANADEPRPTGPTIRAGQPLPLATSTAPQRMVKLNRPVPMPATPPLDAGVMRASYAPSRLLPPQPIIRAKLDTATAPPDGASGSVGMNSVMSYADSSNVPIIVTTVPQESLPMPSPGAIYSPLPGTAQPQPTPWVPVPTAGVPVPNGMVIPNGMPIPNGTPVPSDGVPVPVDGDFSGEPIPLGDCNCAPECCNTGDCCNSCQGCGSCCSLKNWFSNLKCRLRCGHWGCGGGCGCDSGCNGCCNDCGCNDCGSNECACNECAGNDCGCGDCGCNTCGDCGCNTCGCGGCGHGHCCDCFPRPCFWAGVEYLYWNISKQNVVPLLITGNDPNNTLLGAQGTAVLYGANQLNDNNWLSGGRVSAGMWFKHSGCWGLDASGFKIGRKENVFSFASNGDPILVRPFNAIDPVTGAPVASGVFVAGPGVAGSISIKNYSSLWGFDVNLRRKGCCNCNCYLDFLIGYRHLRLDEGIEIDDTEIAVDQTAIAHDRFNTRNIFNGPQVGIDTMVRFGQRWALTGTFKVAFGNIKQTVKINGFTDFTVPVAARGNGGILALPSNIGTHTQQQFAVVPEATLKLHYQITHKWSAFVGYNIIAVSSVLRPGDQIDYTIDPRQIPQLGNLNPTPLGRPAVLMKTTPFFAHGVSAGLMCSF